MAVHDMDILERLRRSVTKGHEPTDADAMAAIAEIARLQLANKQSMEMADMRSADNVKLRQALSKLVTTLTAVENSPSFQGIWPYLHAHGYKYQGPDWRDALADARLVIVSLEQEGSAT